MEALVPQAIEEKSTFLKVQRGLDKGSLGRPLPYTPNQLVQRLDLWKWFHAVPSLPLGSPLLLEITGPTGATKNPVGIYRRATTKQMGLIREETFLSFTTGTLLCSWWALMFSLRAPLFSAPLLLAEIGYQSHAVPLEVLFSGCKARS